MDNFHHPSTVVYLNEITPPTLHAIHSELENHHVNLIEQEATIHKT